MARWYHEDGRRKGSTRQWRYIRERRLRHDGYTCTVIDPDTGERCTANGKSGITLHAHHLDEEGDELVVPVSELRTVCEMHHQQLSWGGFEAEFADGPPRRRAKVAA